MAGNKTVPLDLQPLEVIARVDHPQRRADAEVLLPFFKRITGWPAQMWGPSIIGFGRYHYRYDSGREGEFLITGFSPRKAYTSVYILPGYQDMSDALARLGKVKHGKSCINIKALSDIDMGLLEEMIRDGLAYMQANYETYPR
ncbi:uncharacterized protein DUF1801 [Litoreibacter ponti]|uniref:Uncharacterized protein DUF1801 n=1 Tax=Litoreibacter ponti TaxID=1510457 RepID=A0A2T6BKT6_9RHOB|nr:DUF1801 domain-containing protein [Litoreibacter ponti]PTX56673.1 uncharacterized protein DUF1801 [Litoreibacter ponti]